MEVVVLRDRVPKTMLIWRESLSCLEERFQCSRKEALIRGGGGGGKEAGFENRQVPIHVEHTRDNTKLLRCEYIFPTMVLMFTGVIRQ
jgi:hypothetical protein